MFVLFCASAPWTARAQIDPDKRTLIQLGYNQPLEGRGPIAAYGYGYLNRPNFLEHTNLTLRLAIAPTYLDSELGIAHALGPHTDLAIGAAGGGFAASYSEIRGGHYYREESFTGHPAEVSGSVYHLFNPGALIPLSGIFRVSFNYTGYVRDHDTAPNFLLPDSRTEMRVRTGLRWGGKEPYLTPALGMELSAWHEMQLRNNSGPYGYGGDRAVQELSHWFLGRALLAYTLTNSQDNFQVSITAGTTAQADRFSAFHLGGVLPVAAEFPLMLPGYYPGEVTARSFVHFGGMYSFALDRESHWFVSAMAATAAVDYHRGLEQPGRWHSGVGGGLTYVSPSRSMQVTLGYAYGVNAIRDTGEGAHSVTVLMQFDLERNLKSWREAFTPSLPTHLRSFEEFFRR
ncbi:MAG: hypothetical protein HY301_07845 [Verrucomicrobia bacterium]|nr:hypothetical protein [Verrucomicrobiota bacterium]